MSSKILGCVKIAALYFFSEVIKIKMKLPGLKLPNIGMPKGPGMKNVTKLFNGKEFNTKGLIENAKSRVPKPIQKFIPSFNKGGDKDISSMLKGKLGDIEGIMSKNTNMDDIAKVMSQEKTFDFGNIDIPPEIEKEMGSINLSNIKL